MRSLDDVMLEGEAAVMTLQEIDSIVHEAIIEAGESERLGELGAADLVSAVKTVARRRYKNIRRSVGA